MTLRRVAEAAGTSTMAVYTHFGGMDELRRAVRLDGYERLTAALAGVESGPDAVANVVGLCAAYHANAVAHPDLYRVMFMEEPLDEQDAEACGASFTALVDAVSHALEARALRGDDPEALAANLWAFGHGTISLQLAGLLAPEQATALAASGLGDLLAAHGADRAAVIAAYAAHRAHRSGFE